MLTITRAVSVSVVGLAASVAGISVNAAEAVEELGSGSGFVVSEDGWVVTNWHVIEGCNVVSVPGLGRATEIRADPSNDLVSFGQTATSWRRNLYRRRRLSRRPMNCV